MAASSTAPSPAGYDARGNWLNKPGLPARNELFEPAPAKPVPNKLVNGLLLKESKTAEMWLRLMIPDRGSYCAPCCPERNICCGGKKTVHLQTAAHLDSPKAAWMPSRILDDEWRDFIGALDDANLQGTLNFSSCLLVPCVMPLYPCQPCMFWYPFQMFERKQMIRESAMNLVIAKFNRYLFMPRGIVCRRQAENVPNQDGKQERFTFLRFDMVPSNGPILHLGQLSIGYYPGSQETDVIPLTKQQWFEERLALSEGYPCQDSTNPLCSKMLPPNGVKAYLNGLEREVNDPFLEQRYAERHRMLWDPTMPAGAGPVDSRLPPPPMTPQTSAVDPEEMYRA